MKKRILFGTITVISIIFIIMYLKVDFSDKKIPYTPIDYRNVDKVSIMGFVNKTSADIDIKKIVESINEINKYELKDKPVYHSTPGPEWSIIITMKDKQSFTVYEDYDGKRKISDWHKSYIIDNAIAQQVLKENNLQEGYP